MQKFDSWGVKSKQHQATKPASLASLIPYKYAFMNITFEGTKSICNLGASCAKKIITFHVMAYNCLNLECHSI